MYIDSLEFLDEERDAWHPFEELDGLTDEQLTVEQATARGWSGRDLMAHLLAWQEIALRVARELAVSEISATKAWADGEWAARGEALNDDLLAEWRQLPIDEIRQRFRSVPGELRGYLTVVPESRWLKHSEHLKFFLAETTDHYEAHRADLAAILRGADG
jgi:hypothetical protein